MKKTISDYPELMIEWHPTLNNNLNPSDITIGSNKKCWWICSKKHEWQISSKDKKGCPYCSNRKVCKDNCLATTHPELAKEWHPSLNNLKPSDIVAGSHKKYWWKCEKNHKWQSSCDQRTVKKTGCPYCSNKKVCIDNCLATTYPEIAKEWHPTKNNLNPIDVVAGSNKVFWWKCKKGHEWEASSNSRTCNKAGCPYCSNQKVCKDNCLATTHHELAKEWHPTKNNNLIPDNIVSGSHKKVWWICSKNHEWKISTNARTSKNTGCPYCSNQKVCKDNCLSTTHPELAKEWNPTKNSNLTPNHVTAGSDKKVWWVCSKKHEWQAVCGARTGRGKANCPICNESKGEKEIARILEKLNIKHKREYRFNSCRSKNTLPFDFVIWSNNKIKIIEYHGIQHYKPVNFGSSTICKHESFKEIQYRDKIKKEWCLNKLILFLEISYKDYEKIEKKIERFLSQS